MTHMQIGHEEEINTAILCIQTKFKFDRFGQKKYGDKMKKYIKS